MGNKFDRGTLLVLHSGYFTLYRGMSALNNRKFACYSPMDVIPLDAV